MSKAKDQAITLRVWLSPYSDLRADELHSLSAEQLCQRLHVSYCGGNDWVQVGEAQVTISLALRADVVKSQVAVLREAQTKVRAEAERQAMSLERQIQSLLAIEVAA